jgi:hypothetical protein
VGKAGSGDECSIGLMNRRLAFLTGGIAVAAAALWRVLRQRPREWAEVEAPVDPRAEELRRRLDESRAVVDDRDEFEGAETTVDQAEPVQDPSDRRRAVHAEGRAVVDRMRGGASAEE